MKNKLFGKTTALLMGSMIVFSGQAVAFSCNNQELSDTEPFHNSEMIIAQGASECDETLTPGVGVGVAVSVAIKAFDQSIAVVRTVAVTEAFPPEAKDAVIQALETVQQTLGEAFAKAEVGDNVAVATAISKAISIAGGQAEVVAVADAGAAKAITSATACANQAEAIAKAETGQSN